MNDLDTAALAANDDTTATAVAELPTAAADAPTPDPRDEEIARLKAQIAATDRYRNDEQELLLRRSACMRRMEAAKLALAGEKKELAGVEDEIAALISRGPDLQLNLMDQLAETASPAAAATTASWQETLGAVPADQVFTREDLHIVPEAFRAALLPQALLAMEKRSIANVAMLWDLPWVAEAAWTDGQGAHRVALLPLLSKDEWSQTEAADYGAPVDGFDQTDEAKVTRTLGGPWCGLVVRHGRKTYVVGPRARALHVVWEEAPAAIDDEDLMAEPEELGPED